MGGLVCLAREYGGGPVSWSVVDGDHPWTVME